MGDGDLKRYERRKMLVLLPPHPSLKVRLSHEAGAQCVITAGAAFDETYGSCFSLWCSPEGTLSAMEHAFCHRGQSWALTGSAKSCPGSDATCLLGKLPKRP